ncbi:MAG: transposase [Planctomycetaceae bacterium]|nr:transposase [Planctomycetaceae bacterium]
MNNSQTVRTTEVGGPKGYDSDKKINGLKRHIVVDTIGFLLAVVVYPADERITAEHVWCCTPSGKSSSGCE